MSDRDWREAERAWQADPKDRAKHAAAVAARRRADVPISGPLLEDLILPAQAFESEEAMDIWVLTPERALTFVGHTPGRVEIPEHRGWFGSRVFVAGALVGEAERRGLPGLSTGVLDEARATRLCALDRLEWLGWVRASKPSWLRALGQRVVRLSLSSCFSGRPDWSHSLPELEHLTEVWLEQTPLEPITLAGLARLPGLRRLYAPDPSRHLRGQVHEALPHCRLASAHRIEA